MFGDKALELIKQLQRNTDGSLQPYNEDSIRQVMDEIKVLFEDNKKEMSEVVDGNSDLLPAIHLRHSSIERNKRCLLAYLHNRLNSIKNFRWEFGSVLPPDVKYNMSEQEIRWFNYYNKTLAQYMQSIGGAGLDLTQNVMPPKSLYVEVRCLVDYGEFETQDGDIIQFKKNSQHFLLRSECEQLIRQEILEHIVAL